MCKLYAMMRGPAEAAQFARALTDRNIKQLPMSGFYPNYAAPIILQTGFVALVVREDRWSADAALMNAANPEEWPQLAADTRVESESREAIAACDAALARIGKAQRCSVTLNAAPRPRRGSGSMRNQRHGS